MGQERIYGEVREMSEVIALSSRGEKGRKVNLEYFLQYHLASTRLYPSYTNGILWYRTSWMV